MKKTYRILLFVMLAVSNVFAADYYVKFKIHTDSYYHHGGMEPEVNSEREIWIGEKKMAVISEGSKIIVDLNKNTLIFINLRDSCYAETSLPVDLYQLADEQIVPQLKMYQSVGTVKETDETSKILDYDCKGYDLNVWIEFQGERFNETEIKLWTTTDVPFDLQMYDEMDQQIIKLNNFSDDLLTEIKKVKGFTIVNESVRYQEATAIKSITKMVEISEKKSLPDVYTIPDGFKKKEKLSIEDLRQR